MSKMNPPKPPLPLPWTTKLFVSAVSFLLDASVRRDGSVNRRLLSLLDLKAPPNPAPVDGVSTSDHAVDPARDLRVRLFSPSPTSSPPAAVIVYFHGSGFVFQSAFSRAYDALCRRLSRGIQAHVVSVDYRLAPEHRHPAAYEDGLDVLRWLDSCGLVDGLSATFLAGDSAGGNIAHHVARGEVETESEVRLEGVPFGSRERFKRMWRSFLPAGSGLDHAAANVFGPGSRSGSESWAGFPRTMVVVGGLDTLQDRQRWYAEGLKGAGVDVCLSEHPNAVHGFYGFPELPEAAQFVSDMAEFVKQAGPVKANLGI